MQRQRAALASPSSRRQAQAAAGVRGAAHARGAVRITRLRLRCLGKWAQRRQPLPVFLNARARPAMPPRRAKQRSVAARPRRRSAPRRAAAPHAAPAPCSLHSGPRCQGYPAPRDRGVARSDATRSLQPAVGVHGRRERRAVGTARRLCRSAKAGSVLRGFLTPKGGASKATLPPHPLGRASAGRSTPAPPSQKEIFAERVLEASLYARGLSTRAK
jgi:hypothetical protein